MSVIKTVAVLFGARETLKELPPNLQPGEANDAAWGKRMNSRTREMILTDTLLDMRPPGIGKGRGPDWWLAVSDCILFQERHRENFIFWAAALQEIDDVETARKTLAGRSRSAADVLRMLCEIRDEERRQILARAFEGMENFAFKNEGRMKSILEYLEKEEEAEPSFVSRYSNQEAGYRIETGRLTPKDGGADGRISAGQRRAFARDVIFVMNDSIFEEWVKSKEPSDAISDADREVAAKKLDDRKAAAEAVLAEMEKVKGRYFNNAKGEADEKRRVAAAREAAAREKLKEITSRLKKGESNDWLDQEERRAREIIKGAESLREQAADREKGALYKDRGYDLYIGMYYALRLMNARTGIAVNHLGIDVSGDAKAVAALDRLGIVNNIAPQAATFNPTANPVYELIR